VEAAAATGLMLFFLCAADTHFRVPDHSYTFFLGADFFLPVAVAVLVLGS
jgi:hypothetical protein